MYRLFLCLKYLRRRYLALVAVVAVWLCVAMLVIVASVMDGFLRKVEHAARGLFGEVVVEAGLGGIGRYDEFIAELRREVPEVQAATPVIYTGGILRIGESFTALVQIWGVRMPERLSVTDFGKGLFVQGGRPDAGFDPPLELVLKRVRDHYRKVQELLRREQAKPPSRRDEALLEKLRTATINLSGMIRDLQDSTFLRKRAEEMQRRLQQQRDRPDDRGDEEQIRRLERQLQRLKRRLLRPPGQRVILGSGISGLSFRTPDGQTVRLIAPGRNVVLTFLPVGSPAFSATTIEPVSRTFTVIDDARTDVYTIDSVSVYVPFRTLQELADMGAESDARTGEVITPPRCSQIQIKVRPEFASDRRLPGVCRRIDNAWRRFVLRHPDASRGFVSVRTWRQRLAGYIRTIQRQRTLVTTMFGIISSVSVLLIFAIFYMIVMQKVRDIGVIRAVGGSSGGVAQIFLTFGAVTGALGSAAGVVSGYYFVRYINEIQDFLDRVAGFRVWSAEAFVFAKIPNQVDPGMAVVVAIWAVASGLVGALIPAVRAAVMEPAEAVRYE